jgi:hypothetical protein
MPEHPPVYPVIAWAQEEGGLRTDAMPATATFLSKRGPYLTARHVIELADDPAALRVFFHDEKRFMCATSARCTSRAFVGAGRSRSILTRDLPR